MYLYLVCKHMHLHPHSVVGVGVLDDPCSTQRRFCHSRANSLRTAPASFVILSGAKRSRRILAPQRKRTSCVFPTAFSRRRGGYHPPAQYSLNPRAAPRRIRTISNPVIANQCAHWCGNPFSPPYILFWLMRRRGRRPRRPLQHAPITVPFPGEPAPARA